MLDLTEEVTSNGVESPSMRHQRVRTSSLDIANGEGPPKLRESMRDRSGFQKKYSHERRSRLILLPSSLQPSHPTVSSVTFLLRFVCACVKPRPFSSNGPRPSRGPKRRRTPPLPSTSSWTASSSRNPARSSTATTLALRRSSGGSSSTSPLCDSRP